MTSGAPNWFYASAPDLEPDGLPPMEELQPNPLKKGQVTSKPSSKAPATPKAVAAQGQPRDWHGRWTDVPKSRPRPAARPKPVYLTPRKARPKAKRRGRRRNLVVRSVLALYRWWSEWRIRKLRERAKRNPVLY